MTGSRPARAHELPPSSRTGKMTEGRQADSARRRQRVIAVLNKAAADGSEISVSSIARAAAVDRTFLYRHRDLLAKIHALEAAPPAASHAGPAVTRASLQADLLAAQERAIRLSARIQQLERRLSEALGEQAWRESGSAPQPTSTPSTRRSTTSSSKPPTSNSSSPNATTTSPQREPPTASSSPSSTTRPRAGDPPPPTCTTPVAQHHQPAGLLTS